VTLLEVADEQGRVKNVRLVPNDYACQCLTERESLILIRVNPNADAEFQFTPILDSKVNDALFIARLNSKPVEVSKKNSRDFKLDATSTKSVQKKGSSVDWRRLTRRGGAVKQKKLSTDHKK